MKATVKGEEFDVAVSVDGEFSATVDGSKIKSVTLDGLKKSIARMMSTKKVRLNIPFYRITDYPTRLQKGSITGIHAGTDNLLIQWENGASEQDRWGGKFYDLTPEEAKEYWRLFTESRNADDALQKFENAHSFNGRAKATQELEKILAKEPASQFIPYLQISVEHSSRSG